MAAKKNVHDFNLAKTIENIDKIAWDNLEKKIRTDYDKTSAIYLYTEAIKYLSKIDIMRKELKRFTFLLQDQKRIRDSYDKNMYKTSIDAEKYNRQREEISNFLASDAAKIYISASLDFQKTLNEVLGQKIQTIFVYDLGNENETSELFEIESLDLLKFDYNTSYQLTARYRKIDQEFLNMKRRFKHDEKLKFSLPNLKIGYTETLDRFRKSKKTSNLSHYVLFKLADKWQTMKVSAEGDIHEAYASFIILNKSTPSFKSSDKEYLVYQFLKYGVANVDNISGLLQGDVSKGNIEYAIKSANASLLSLQQIDKLAQEIVKSKGRFDINKLKKKKEELRKKGRTRNKFQDKTQEELEELINLIIKEN